ncbi:MAG TPA: hypothetical protein VFV75_01515 [Candidatus Polarisedimenticolaceae bacterium]|nr:hypothetical protein [Candidatus Polarisedimenticolaceae bacterium]
MSTLAERLLVAAAWNAVLALVATGAAAPDVPAPVRMAAAGLLVLVLPGMAFLGAFRRALDPPRLALAVVGLSCLVMGTGLLATAMGPQDPSRLRLLGVVAALGSAALLVLGPPRRPAPGSPWLLLGATAAAGFALASAAALHLFPPFPDTEREVRGTAWGLAATGRPWLPGEHARPLVLGHPLMLHALVAESLLVTGEIGVTQSTYTSARAASAARAAGVPVDQEEVRRADHATFLSQPALLPTRAVSAMLFAGTLALLCELCRRLTGSRTAGLTAAALFALSPATLLHAGSAGHGAAAAFAMLATALLTEAPLGRRPELGWIAAGAALGAVLDQGTAVLALGAAALAAVRAGVAAARAPAARLRTAREAFEGRAVALLGGFLGGTALWWGYGLWVDAAGFAEEHLRAPALGGGPSIAAAWAALSAATGHGVLPVGLAALAVWAVARGASEPRRTLAGWGLLAALAGALPGALPAVVAAAVALAWTGDPRRPRTGEPLRAVPRPVAWTAAGLLLISLVFEGAAVLRLVQDFRP